MSEIILVEVASYSLEGIGDNDILLLFHNFRLCFYRLQNYIKIGNEESFITDFYDFYLLLDTKVVILK